ncbi:unnamed protein product, partial [marine sediment metagenome]
MNMKTTEKQFESFKQECHKWIKFFGLKDWRIKITHEDIDENFTAADVTHNSRSRQAAIRLNTTLHDDLKDIDVKVSAFHEVCHLLLADLTCLTRSRECSEYEIEK